ncbi:uncharacterized protein F4822DRAFT_410281 [Hypoxylon trugodes]|uniref:uncharacterized protein n=1 Tax=Hypoxylon trugodes TaxID=326681 RepID=UPI00218DF0F7|nr:uncharacterized protein F4822DRAFT_410281 [Hypoxylon trugodes]KAI1386491.1 hypothetical protein F4822DRAFT_410281 [Hypoxylon trugodes]
MATEWNKLKVVDLKAELKRLGLPQNGLKAELVARLEAADSERAASEPSEGATDDTQTVNGDSQPEQEQESSTVPEPTEPEPSLPDEPSKQIESEDVPAANDAPTPAAVEPQAAPAPISSDATPLQPTEVLQDSQKRKRRSLSPAPSAEEIARKRVKQESSQKQDENSTNAVSGEVDETVAPIEKSQESNQAPTDIEMQGVEDEAPIERGHEHERDNGVAQSSPARDTHPDDQNGHPAEIVTNNMQPTPEEPVDEQMYTAQPTEIERDVEPSIHPATAALYIKNFMRPLRPQTVQQHLLDLATPAGVPIDEDTISDFYLDTIRTHAFVVFNTISSASRVRNALHNRVWPDETNRKALWVDFMPSEHFEGWVEMEQSTSGGRGSSSRFEVVYDHDNDGEVTARLEAFDGVAPTSKPAPVSSEPIPERKPSIPTGPSRPFAGIEGAPTGPRNFQAGRGPPMHPSRMGRVDQGGLPTRTSPVVMYQPVSDNIARRRLDAITAAKSKETGKDFGKEYKRYYFEHGDLLVDRGPEIFLGIRPPHRERERRGERPPIREAPRGRRGGGGGGSRRRGGMPIFHGVPRGGDRFRPGDSATGGGANGRSRYGDDRGSRRDRFGDDRGSRRDGYSRY